jgi:hypothetical protein
VKAPFKHAVTDAEGLIDQAEQKVDAVETALRAAVVATCAGAVAPNDERSRTSPLRIY